MPEIIYPDKPVSLHLSFTTTQNDVVKLFFGGSARANLEPIAVTRGARGFVNADGEDQFTLDGSGNPSSYSETLTASLGAGHKEGDRIALRTEFSIVVCRWAQLCLRVEAG